MRTYSVWFWIEIQISTIQLFRNGMAIEIDEDLLLRHTNSIISELVEMKWRCHPNVSHGKSSAKRLNLFSENVIHAYNYPFVQSSLQPSAKPFKTKRIITMESIKNTYKSFVFHLHRKSINHFGFRASPLHSVPLPASDFLSAAHKTFII